MASFKGEAESGKKAETKCCLCGGDANNSDHVYGCCVVSKQFKAMLGIKSATNLFGTKTVPETIL